MDKLTAIIRDYLKACRVATPNLAAIARKHGVSRSYVHTIARVVDAMKGKK